MLYYSKMYQLMSVFLNYLNVAYTIRTVVSMIVLKYNGVLNTMVIMSCFVCIKLSGIIHRFSTIAFHSHSCVFICACILCYPCVSILIHSYICVFTHIHLDPIIPTHVHVLIMVSSCI